MDSLRAVGRPVVGGGGTHPGEFRPGDRRKGGGGVQAEQVKTEVWTERLEKAAEVWVERKESGQSRGRRKFGPKGRREGVRDLDRTERAGRMRTGVRFGRTET